MTEQQKKKIRDYEIRCLDVLEDMGASLPAYEFRIGEELDREPGRMDQEEERTVLKLNPMLFRKGADEKPLFGTIGRLLLMASNANVVTPNSKYRQTYGLSQEEWNLTEKASIMGALGVPANMFWDIDYLKGNEEEVVDVECRCQHHLIIPSDYEEIILTCPFCGQEIIMHGSDAGYPGKNWKFMVSEYHPMYEIIEFPAKR